MHEFRDLCNFAKITDCEYAIFSILLSSASKHAKFKGHQNNLVHQTTRIKGNQNYGCYSSNIGHWYVYVASHFAVVTCVTCIVQTSMPAAEAQC